MCIRWIPPGWSTCEVRIERITANLSICCEIFGINSQTRVPATLVEISRNKPPVGRPIFMSKVSNWLAPPFIQSRMHRFCFLLTSLAAACEWNKLPQFISEPPVAVAMVPFSNARRDRCSKRGQNGFMAIVPVKFAWLVGAWGEVVNCTA